MEQQFSLRWNNYLNQITDAFGSLRDEEDLVDVTLSCEGKKLKAHKMLLSACSSYFRDIFKENPCQHPVIVFRNVKYADLQAIIDFIYQGEVSVLQEQLESFLGTAELLEIKGLTESTGKDIPYEDEDNNVVAKETVSDRLQHDERNALQMLPQPVAARSSSPPVKKRKYSNRDKLSGKKETESEVKDTLVPPTIKHEEFIIEDLTFDEDEDVKIPLSPNTDPLPENLKPDDPVAFSTNMDSSHSLTERDSLPMGQMLIPGAGPSIEGLPQESIQAEDVDEPMEEGIVTNDKTEPEKPRDEQLEKHEKVTVTHKTLSNEETIDEELEEAKEESPTKDDKKSETLEYETEVLKEPKRPLEVEKEISKTALSNTTSKKKVGMHLPKGLTVTISPVTKEDILKLEDSEEDGYNGFRSEEAKTPVQEDPVSFQAHPYQQADIPGVTTSPYLVKEGEPEMAEAADQGEDDTPPEEEKEPEFNYYGCETCKAETKPVDRFNFTHKCPICPCVCFCAHLLKEHMKVIHGWFNVQRRFNQY